MYIGRWVFWLQLDQFVIREAGGVAQLIKQSATVLHTCVNILEIVDGWMTCGFQQYLSYQDNGRMIMKGCVQWIPVYSLEGFALSRAQTQDG